MHTTAFAQPKAVVSTLEYDGGKVLPREKVFHNFVITNEGSDDLILQDIRTTCGCTAAIPSATRIVPGATGIVSVTMTTGTSDATLSKKAIVNTNDPKNSQLSLAIKAKVRNLIAIAPEPYFNFGEVPFQETREQTLYLQSKDGNEFEITDARSLSNSIEINTEQKQEQGIPVTVTLQADRIQPNLSTMVELHTTHPKQSILRVRVIAKVIGSIEFDPNALFFGIVEPGATVTKEVLVALSKFAKSSEFEIQGVEKIENEIVKTKILPKNENGNYKLRVDFTAPENPGYQAGQIQLRTNLESQKIATLRFSGIVRAKK